MNDNEVKIVFVFSKAALELQLFDRYLKLTFEKSKIIFMFYLEASLAEKKE
jgi:hypothetical protein